MQSGIIGLHNTSTRLESDKNASCTGWPRGRMCPQADGTTYPAQSLDLGGKEISPGRRARGHGQCQTVSHHYLSTWCGKFSKINVVRIHSFIYLFITI